MYDFREGVRATRLAEITSAIKMNEMIGAAATALTEMTWHKTESVYRAAIVGPENTIYNYTIYIPDTIERNNKSFSFFFLASHAQS